MFKNFVKMNDLEALKDVVKYGSDAESDPLNDESVTLFLKNGYRLISTKDINGQSLQLVPFDGEAKLKRADSYEATIFHEIVNLNTPADIFEKVVDGIRKTISSQEFMDALSKIVSNETMDYLEKRHNIIVFKQISALRP